LLGHGAVQRLVGFTIMGAAVDFDNQTLGWAEEIDDAEIYDRLPAKF
jgi:hypothetical protein